MLPCTAQVTIFSDDFDSGTSAWTLTGQWGTTTAQAFNGTSSLTDSPGAVYLNQQTTTATITQAFNLNSALDANVYFKMKYDIENGFDYCYVDVSSNNGSSWVAAYTINGEGNTASWEDVNVNIGGFAGNAQVKVRFRFFADQALQFDGIYIDSMRITSDTVDNSPPLIIHEPQIHYEGTFGVNERLITITDISGIADAKMFYNVDGGAYTTINASDTSGNNYLFEIPSQDAGAYVDYYISATDSSTQANTAISDTFKYVSGNYVKYEEGIVDFIQSYSSTAFYTTAAMRMTIDQPTTITTAFIGNYTDFTNPNDSMEFHVWADNNGQPGTDLITPFMVFPEANLSAPYQITRIDLRPYASQLDSLSGDVYIGFEATGNNVWVTVTDTLATSGDRAYRFDGTTWSTQADFLQFRIVTDTAAPIADFSFDATGDPTVSFTDESANFPTDWDWDFGDGNTDNVQHPTHTYALPGNYNVCLVASNSAGADSICKLVVVNNGPPVADFNFDPISDPEIDFFDASTNLPTSWNWDFGDGNGDIIMNPTHTYSDTGDYEVCLTVSNAYGTDDTCQNIRIDNTKPIAYFTHVVVFDTVVYFTDLSSLNPTQWDWDFDYNGETSTNQSPTQEYDSDGGTYNVCLIASNDYGSSDPYCDEVVIEEVVGVPNYTGAQFSVYPNPSTTIINVDYPETAHSTDYQMMDASGVVVLKGTSSSNRIQLEVGDLPSGSYLLSLSSDNLRVNNYPIIIQH
ncbi:MAG: hypothetical protein Salg2KO_06060 [Salibacteraceae bacterium]